MCPLTYVHSFRRFVVTHFIYTLGAFFLDDTTSFEGIFGLYFQTHAIGTKAAQAITILVHRQGSRSFDVSPWFHGSRKPYLITPWFK
jgi:hypothetical protein